MIWLRWSVGKIAIWLPHRLHERDRADVDRIRNAIADRHVELRDRTVRLDHGLRAGRRHVGEPRRRDRKSTRLNSSHVAISYAVFCLKKKHKIHFRTR